MESGFCSLNGLFPPIACPVCVLPTTKIHVHGDGVGVYAD